MPANLQESVDKLLGGDELAWDEHGGHAGGSVTLEAPVARRLFQYLLSQPQELMASGGEALFPGLIEAWGNEEHDPKDDVHAFGAIAGVSGFRLAKIETEGFGGLNLFGGPSFFLDVDRQSWCLEGQNGSGKTSLISAVIWGLTGRRIREHLGPVLDKGNREPVFDLNGDQIGTWPPLASYPSRQEDLSQDARVWVKLTFRNTDGDEAIAERSIVRKADGTIDKEKQSVDPRLLSAPQLVDSGILMPSRMVHINFGEKSQTLYQAVKMLTGLDQLGAIGYGAAALTDRRRKFVKYAKDQGIEQIVTQYAKGFAETDEHAKAVTLNLSEIKAIENAKVIEKLEELIKSISVKAGEYAETLKSVVGDEIELSEFQGRQRVSEAVGVAKDAAKKAAENVRAFSVLKELFKAKGDTHLERLLDAISTADKQLATALEWHRRQEADIRLRLKALASKWYEEPESPNDLANCPLCFGDLVTPEQKVLQNELKDLKAAGEEAERRFEDVCLTVRENLLAALPQGLHAHIKALGTIEPKSDIVDAATQAFTDQPPFSDVLTGAAEVMKEVIPVKAGMLSAFEPASQLRVVDGEPDCASSIRELLYQFELILELADWWDAHRTEFVDFWKGVVGLVPEGEEPASDTFMGQVAIVENALAASKPYDVVLKKLKELEALAKSWRVINEEQKRRDDIAAALEPLKTLRAFVDTETARSIASLSERIEEFLDRIHIKERLEFHDAGLKKKEVHIHGAFTEGMKFDALPIANSSWLRAILWAFIFALREKSIEAFGGNPLPLILLDDPQTTFDPRNKRKWAEELAQLAGLDEGNVNAAQLFLTTNERQFFTLLTEVNKLNGQEGLIAPPDDNSKVVNIVNGNVLERIFREANENNDDARARDFIRQVRIYVEKLLKHMLRGEGTHIANSNLQILRNELKVLRNTRRVAPFTSLPFGQLLKVLDRDDPAISLINDPPHDDDETTGISEAKDVQEYWEKVLKNCIQNAFHAYASFEAFHGDPRTFAYHDNVVMLPVGQNEEVRKAELFRTGKAVAAKTDGRAGDGELRIEEWENAEKVTLPNHEVYRLVANTLEPVASIGNLVIVSNYAKVKSKHLVAAAVGERLLVRRLQASEVHPDLAILTAQAMNPYEIEPPEIAPLEGLSLKKIVGTIFTSGTGEEVTLNELEAIENPNEFLSVLDQARLFLVEGRSAEPIALDGQYMMVGEPVEDQSKWEELDGRLVIGVDNDGASYFKRLRSPRAGLYVMESLNPDGTTRAELLSVDGRDGIPQLVHVLPVIGVLFELPNETH